MKSLAEALSKNNNEFSGPLNLSDNGLTDLSALYISKAEFNGITSLDLSKNSMSSKAGVFIGEALINKPTYEIEELNFKEINLGEVGLRRILEACNKNGNIEKINIGIVGNKGLALMAELLVDNTTLKKVKFEEDPQERWEEVAEKAFTEMVAKNIFITKFKLKPIDEEKSDLFLKEVKFHCKRTKKELKKEKRVMKRDKELSAKSGVK